MSRDGVDHNDELHGIELDWRGLPRGFGPRGDSDRSMALILQGFKEVDSSMEDRMPDARDLFNANMSVSTTAPLSARDLASFLSDSITSDFDAELGNVTATTAFTATSFNTPEPIFPSVGGSRRGVGQGESLDSVNGSGKKCIMMLWDVNSSVGNAKLGQSLQRTGYS